MTVVKINNDIDDQKYDDNNDTDDAQDQKRGLFLVRHDENSLFYYLVIDLMRNITDKTSQIDSDNAFFFAFL